ncbi:MAG: ABC transporter substrate-binding protein, partial [Tissierellia bacterium]|nr:ABC transporter substrate-binding protein [Tissierellia bacterium]
MISKKKNLFLILTLILMLITAACSKETNNVEAINIDNQDAEENYYIFSDALGTEVVLERKPERVVSLLGSYSETWALAGGSLAGLTDDVQKEGRMEITNDIQIVGTVKEPNLEGILSLNPDFVILTPDVDNQVKIAETLKQLNINHAFFKVEEFEDYLNMLNICTDITGRKDLYEENGLKIKKDIDDILYKVEGAKKEELKVLFVRAFSSGAKAKKDDNMTCTML